MEYTNKELERMINDIISPSKAPIENKYLVDNPKALNALIKTIQTLSQMLNMKISNAILRHAKFTGYKIMIILKQKIILKKHLVGLWKT